MKRKKRKTGQVIIIFFSAGTRPLINPIDAKYELILYLHMQDHMNATATIITFIKFSIEMIRIIIAARSIGKRQYPSKQTIWKKELYFIIFIYVRASRNWELRVIIKPPIHTMKKIIMNTSSFELFFDEQAIVLN